MASACASTEDYAAFERVDPSQLNHVQHRCLAVLKSGRANDELRVSLQRAQQYALAAEEANKGLARAAEGWLQYALASLEQANAVVQESFEQWTLKVEDTSIAPTGF